MPRSFMCAACRKNDDELNLLDLPGSIHLRIMQSFGFRDSLSLMCTCKALRNFALRSDLPALIHVDWSCGIYRDSTAGTSNRRRKQRKKLAAFLAILTTLAPRLKSLTSYGNRDTGEGMSVELVRSISNFVEKFPRLETLHFKFLCSQSQTDTVDALLNLTRLAPNVRQLSLHLHSLDNAVCKAINEKWTANLRMVEVNTLRPPYTNSLLLEGCQLQIARFSRFSFSKQSLSKVLLSSSTTLTELKLWPSTSKDVAEVVESAIATCSNLEFVDLGIRWRWPYYASPLQSLTRLTHLHCYPSGCLELWNEIFANATFSLKKLGLTLYKLDGAENLLDVISAKNPNLEVLAISVLQRAGDNPTDCFASLMSLHALQALLLRVSYRYRLCVEQLLSTSRLCTGVNSQTHPDLRFVELSYRFQSPEAQSLLGNVERRLPNCKCTSGDWCKHHENPDECACFAEKSKYICCLFDGV